MLSSFSRNQVWGGTLGPLKLWGTVGAGLESE